MRKKAHIIEGHSTMMKPDWAALVIDVIDASRTSVNESYELFNAEDDETYGPGFGIEEERGAFESDDCFHPNEEPKEICTGCGLNFARKGAL